MQNIFQIGGIASNQSFIGRQDLLSIYRKQYIEENYRVGKSLVGITKIGKTSFLNMLFSDIPDDILFISHDLNLCYSYYDLWKKICSIILSYLEGRKEKDQNIKNFLIGSNTEKLLKDIRDISNMEWYIFSSNILEIFDDLKSLNIRTIIVLDEFDYAENLFESKTPYFALFRDVFSNYGVSSMLISRKQLKDIEKTTYQASTFRGVLDTTYLKGFDDKDMNNYYKIFYDENIVLSDEQKDEIEYYSGRIPYILSIMGHYIIESAKNGEKIDIKNIFSNKCNLIHQYYKNCIKDWNHSGDLKRIIPFIIGPNMGVTKNDRDELINLGYLRVENGKYLSISKYFVESLPTNIKTLGLKNTWDNIIKLEKKIKSIIEIEFINIVNYFKVDGNDINSIQQNILIKIDELSKKIDKYNIFIKNNLEQYGKNSSYLDVISLKDSFEIIKKCWCIFSKYFDYEEYSTNWESKFDKCGNARNALAHAHENYLTDLDKQEIDIYCGQILDLLSNSQISKLSPSKNDIIKAASIYTSYKSLKPKSTYEIPDERLVGKMVDLCVSARSGRDKRTLRGLVNGKYKGIIAKTYLESFTISELDNMIGKTIKVEVDTINENYYMLIYNPNNLI